MSHGKNRTRIWLIALALLLIALVLLRLMIDRSIETGAMSLRRPDAAVLSFRVSAAIGSVVVGGCLALAGLLLQAMLRNPLAAPSIIGVSSGAGLGVMVAMYIAQSAGGAMAIASTFAGSSVAAVIGGLSALGVVMLLGQRRGVLDPVSVILIGVVVSTMCGAAIMFVQHLVPSGVRGDFTRWLMGTIPERPERGLLITCVVALVLGVAAAMRVGRAMDAAMLSDDEARSVGVRIGVLRLTLFVMAGVLTALSVALAGPIGFVGLIAPHAARLVIGPAHRPLVLATVLIGGIVVVGAEVARQAIDFGAGRIQIGILTAMLGGPMFLWLLLRRGRDL